MAEGKITGVTPVNDIEFGVCTAGRPEDSALETATYTVVKDAESLAITIDGKVEEWNPMDTKGWIRRLMTGKSISISMGGKRNYGDAGNDYVAGLAYKTGQVCNSAMKITFPDKDALIIPCVINVTSLGGDSTAINGLEWEALSDGKPIYVVAK
ncbi:MAG: phage tail tube protein [Lachnospiraceae bacterium]